VFIQKRADFISARFYLQITLLPLIPNMIKGSNKILKHPTMTIKNTIAS